jgi:Protein of unknown function (DUF3341)
MVAENAAVFGIFASRASAEAAVDQLTAAGFSTQDVSVLMSGMEGSKEFATERNTKADAATGVAVGGVVGGTLGLLAGIGALTIPGAGPLIAAGPIVAGLAGLGVGGAVGGLVGALVSLGIPEFEAKLYDGRVKDGELLLSIQCVRCEEVSNARAILTAVGALDIASFGEESIAGYGVHEDDTGFVTNTPAHATIADKVEAIQ